LSYYQPGSWKDKLDRILRINVPSRLPPVLFLQELRNDWRPYLPRGFTLRPADRKSRDPLIKNPDFLTDEMCSERESVEDFLQTSFGLCLVHDHEIGGWCLSEYNHADGCEIGIATSPPYQRRGFATLMTSAS
jgi:RimJ/RimL family protein N-acetyltransferase